MPGTTRGITEGILDVGSHAGRQAGSTLTSEEGISIVAGGMAAVVCQVASRWGRMETGL